mmetsp:Transcript_17362/g.35081  ORF Transcript_17362/g.35081 Transcript_17362/m.35081 type:complete len:214 (-) Transcript_17362:994-1635(-)
MDHLATEEVCTALGESSTSLLTSAISRLTSASLSRGFGAGVSAELSTSFGACPTVSLRKELMMPLVISDIFRNDDSSRPPSSPPVPAPTCFEGKTTAVISSSARAVSSPIGTILSTSDLVADLSPPRSCNWSFEVLKEKEPSWLRTTLNISDFSLPPSSSSSSSSSFSQSSLLGCSVGIFRAPCFSTPCRRSFSSSGGGAVVARLIRSFAATE